MEILIVFGLYLIYRFCRDMGRVTKEAEDLVRRNMDLIEAKKDLARVSQMAAELRRDIDQFRDGPGGDIPPGAPDPLADFMARRRADTRRAHGSDAPGA